MKTIKNFINKTENKLMAKVYSINEKLNKKLAEKRGSELVEKGVVIIIVVVIATIVLLYLKNDFVTQLLDNIKSKIFDLFK